MDGLNRLSIEAFNGQEKIPVVLLLDNIRSALNVGSIFRTADAFLIERVILCGITAQPPHREILKTALGSTDTVQWEYEENTVRAVQTLQTNAYQVWAIEQTTQKIWLQDFLPISGQKYAFILGNEVDGVSNEAIALCDGIIEIPQYGTKHSLNVAVAAGIVIWEATKKMIKS